MKKREKQTNETKNFMDDLSGERERWTESAQGFSNQIATMIVIVCEHEISPRDLLDINLHMHQLCHPSRIANYQRVRAMHPNATTTTPFIMSVFRLCTRSTFNLGIHFGSKHVGSIHVLFHQTVGV